MSESVMTALIALVGTALGSLGGIIASQRLTEHRLRTLEEKQDRHNAVIERTYRLEDAVSELRRDVRDIRNGMGARKDG